MKNVYLAGRMTGVPDYNYSEFIRTAEMLRAITGAQVVHTANAPRRDTLEHRHYMEWGRVWLNLCDAVAVLPDWEKSAGTRQEIEMATAMKLPIFYLPNQTQRLCEWAVETENQIDRLAEFIMLHVPGEPSRSEGAVDTAVRLLGEIYRR